MEGEVVERWVSHRMHVMVYLPTFWVNLLLVKGWFPNTQWGEKEVSIFRLEGYTYKYLHIYIYIEGLYFFSSWKVFKNYTP